MVIRLLTILICALIATAGVFITQRHLPKQATGEIITTQQILQHLNGLRESNRALEWDGELATWLEGRIPLGAQVEGVSADALLKTLQTDVPSLAAASAGVFRAPTVGPTFFQELDEWLDVRDSDYTHAALVTRTSETQPGLINTWAVLAIRFPDFSPDQLTGKYHEFHHLCARCGKDYNGRFSGGDRILLLRCPHCDNTHDILAVGTNNRYRRVNAFLDRFEPPAQFPEGMSKREEMKRIWHAVLNHCQYTNDSGSKFPSSKDYWQSSRETFRKQLGDCEDSSILLVDWLSARGIDARVVIGETSSLQGHAWCVARVDGQSYLLETTITAENAQKLRPVEETEDEYRPDYQFTHDKLYFRQGKEAWITDYWSEELWATVDFSDETAPREDLSEDLQMAWFDESVRLPTVLTTSTASQAPAADSH